MSLPSTSIKRPVTITMFYLGIGLIAVYAFTRIGVDLLPNVNIPHLIIQTNYSNASPEEIEKLVTEPLESAAGTVTGVKNITSVSKEGISVISLDFVWGTNIDYALISLREKLDNVRFILPEGAERPTIIRADPSSTPILTLVLTYQEKPALGGSFVSSRSDSRDIKRLIDLKEAGRVIFKRRLEQVDGVAQAVLTGGLEREIEVEINPEKLSEFRLTFSEIAEALRASNVNLPAGTILDGLFRYSLRAVGEFQNINDIENTIIRRNPDGSVLFLKDIAIVKEGFKQRDGLTRYNGSETVGILIYKEPLSNTVTIAGSVKKIIEQLNKEYPDYQISIVSDYSAFIVNAIQNVKQEILFGGILAFLVLFFFLNNLRSVFIIGVTIPASLILTILLMYLFKINFNIVSLGGMALGVGMLLDNAIIVIENVIRLREKGCSFYEAALKGSTEVEMPIIAATLTTIAVFLPLVFVSGIAGELFKDQSYAIVFSLASSIIVAITLIPMLASREKFNFNLSKYSKNEFLYFDYPKNGKLKDKIIFWIKFPFVLLAKSILYVFSFLFKIISDKSKYFFDNFFKKTNSFLDKTIIYYDKLLLWSLNNRVKVIVVTIILFLIAVLAFIDMKKEFIPGGAAKEFVVQLTFPEGTSLEGNEQITSKIESAILNIKGVESEVANIGRVNEFDYLNKNQISVEKTNIIVKLISDEFYYTAQAKLRTILEELKLVKHSFEPVKNAYAQVLSGSDNDIQVKIKNKNLYSAAAKANYLVQKITRLRRVTDIRSSIGNGQPEYSISIDGEKCLAYGVRLSDAADQIVNLVKGMNAAYFTDFDKKIAVNLTVPFKSKNDVEEILSYDIVQNNQKIPLKNLVNYKLTRSYDEIWRENLSRTVYIYANPEGASLDDAIKNINEIINKAPKDPGELITVGGTNQEIKESFNSLYAALIISVLLMFMILASEFESIIFPFIIIFSVPLGLIGGILILYIFGQSISIISIMGLIILVGIADNDAVVKVEYIIRKRREGLPMNEAILEAGKQRFRPIVMNSLTVIFGLLPMMIGIGAGTQLRVSLSLAVAGGLVFSTILTLIIIPVLYSYFEKLSRKKWG